MSDDDSMLLNFTTDDTPSVGRSVSTKVTGGRWKDRRKMKMKMDGREPKRRRVDHSEDSEIKNDAIMEDKDIPKAFKESKAPQPPVSRQRATNPISAKDVDSQIVSSLFTSNREITTSINTNKHDETAKVNPSNAPLLIDSFESLGVKEPVVSHLNEKMKIKKPTSIQKLIIPQLLTKNNDLFIHAQTGSGKTLAYLLPILSRILDMNVRVDRKSGSFALIIAPTRELASQIYHVASMLTNCCHYLVPCLLIGGERKKSEKARLRKGCNFIIGTPGRILDHLQNTKVIREQMGNTLRYVVLDEGDKLMELGFEETITEILKIVHEIPVNQSQFPQLPPRIVHALCSATAKGGVTKLGNVALQNYKLISNGNTKSNELTTVPDQLLQKITIVPPKLRLVTLAAALNNIDAKYRKEENSKEETLRTIVFLSCSDTVDYHYEVFSSSDSAHRNLVGDSVRLLTRGNTILPSFDPSEDPNVICYKLHGSLSQPIRNSTLKHFSQNNETTKGKHLIMFCTDVASRGLDLPNVSTVIELDPPFAVEDHLHRIGRTARAGHSGEALLFLLPGEEEGYMECIKPYHPKGWKLLQYTDDLLKPAFQDVRVGRNDKTDKKEMVSNEWDTNATTWHLNVERRLLDDSTFKSIAMQAYTSHVRAYATHISQEKKIFNVRALHLGHLAKSFALRERPKSMGSQTSKDKNSEPKKKESGKNKVFRMARQVQKENVSEFNY